MTAANAVARVLQIARLGVIVDDGEAMRSAWVGFARARAVRLPGFLEPSLLDRFQRGLDNATLAPRIHRRLDPPPMDLVLRDAGLLGRMQFLVNDARVFDAIRRITGCGPIGCFMGSVYRMVPGAGHDDVWHDDMDGVRMLTLSVNLGRAPYRGGVLQLRERRGGRIIFEAANTGPGDAILFEISGALEHRVTGVEGDAPKTALAGWFRREPAVTTWLKPTATA